MKLFAMLLLLPLAAHADDVKPIRMASVHGNIMKLAIDRRGGSEDVIATPVCKFTGTIPVYDFRKDEDSVQNPILASCTSDVGGTAVKVNLNGKVMLEVWDAKDVKGANFLLIAGSDAKGAKLPKPLNGYVGSRDLSARNLMTYLDPTGWNGSPDQPE
ncbi:MAG: hypothetical protein ACXWQO_16980 [Bdellovibrionota bacterium]